jgi:hypothetical protein
MSDRGRGWPAGGGTFSGPMRCCSGRRGGAGARSVLGAAQDPMYARAQHALAHRVGSLLTENSAPRALFRERNGGLKPARHDAAMGAADWHRVWAGRGAGAAVQRADQAGALQLRAAGLQRNTHTSARACMSSAVSNRFRTPRPRGTGAVTAAAGHVQRATAHRGTSAPTLLLPAWHALAR